MAEVLFPKCGMGEFRERPEQLLILCYYDPMGISTVPETVAYIQSHSIFSVTVLNLFEHRRSSGALSLSSQLNLKKFDGIVVHNSLSYNVDNLYSLDGLLEFKIKDFQGAKILMKQDENFKFRELAKYIGEAKYDLIFTCLPTDVVPLVYPEGLVGRPIFSRMLTGYVTPTLRSIERRLNVRTIDIGYRGSIQPLSFGRLAYEKRKIGDDIISALQGQNLVLDISSRWEDRLGTSSWLDFLANCKATLGVESGASIFDLDGDLDERCARVERKLGPPRNDPEYAELYLASLADLEGKIKYHQISPRHFEAAATRTLQIMYPGEYSGIFIAGRHYVELNRDLSNLDQVLTLVHNEERRSEIVECAYKEIIENPRFWIESFVKKFDRLIARVLWKKGGYRKPSAVVGRNSSNVLVICAHKPSIDPRLSWIAYGAPFNLHITQVGVLPTGSEEPRLNHLDGDRMVLMDRVPFTPLILDKWFSLAGSDFAGWEGLSEINAISFLLSLDESRLLEFLGAPPSADRVGSFKWYLQYILNTTATLVEQVRQMRGFTTIIATDLDALPAALILKGMCKVPVVYDAHEYWPEADVASFEFEKQFWIALERRLVQYVDHCQTVSPGLAMLMSMQYGQNFHVVPNCEPIISWKGELSSAGVSDGKCRFIFQGNFAPRRGLDLLIDAWPDTDHRAILILRGPNNDYKEELIARVRKIGLFETRIVFAAPVSETELVNAARQGDVGLIPYTPFGANYSHCCPNKTSQYMAGGLPILANRTSFVEQIVRDSQAGLVVDFSRPSEIVSAVSWFVDHVDARLDMGRKALSYFEQSFHWEVVSRDMYAAIGRFVEQLPRKPLRIFSERVEEGLYFQGCNKKEQVVSLSESVQEQTLPLLQQIWRFFPAGFRYRYGPSLRRKVLSLFR